MLFLASFPVNEAMLFLARDSTNKKVQYEQVFPPTHFTICFPFDYAVKTSGSVRMCWARLMEMVHLSKHIFTNYLSDLHSYSERTQPMVDCHQAFVATSGLVVLG